MTVNSKTVGYAYTASGIKIRNQIGTKNLYYIGNFVYEGSSLKYILHDEGRIVVNGSSAIYEYHLKDHLGNTRVAFQENQTNPIQSTDYYPFGLAMNMSEGSTNKYLYNGKEMQEETDWLDYGARMYDPSLGRWHCSDPLAESYDSWSPYNYVLNDPIRNIDPDGMKVVKTDSSYNITGDDIYTYIGYLSQISSGKGSMKNLQSGLEAASQEDDGNGGAMATTVGEVNVAGSYDLFFNKINSKKYPFAPDMAGQFEGSNGFLYYAFNNGNFGRYSYNLDGEAIGLAPITGTAPTPGKISGKAAKVLGNLKNISNLTLREGVLLRGGKAGNLRVVGEWLHDKQIIEVGKLAAKGDREAMTAIKILKQAAKKAQKY
ncbi:RHS repeat domain-containing protein [Labilibaculum euxinus]